MRRLFTTLLASCALLAAVPTEASVIRLVEFEAAITPLTAKRIIRAIDDAEEAGDDLVLIELDTPGGLVVSMEAIVKRMLDADVPIVVWVGPPGAKAASAGFFVLIAADVAAMAPGTRTGASSTVYGMGENREDDVLLKKANEDLAALLRSIATKRGRNPQVAENAVFSAKAWEETVAIDEGLVDLIAADREELLELLDGREIRRFDGELATLSTSDPIFVVSEFSLRHRFLEVLATPAVAAVLLMIGMAGLYIEFTQPGVVLPGVVGALALLLFALTAQVLPVSTVGVLLIVLAIVMFVLEIKVASYGMLTAGGAISLIIGSWMLIDGPIPELRVPLEVVLPTGLAIVAVVSVAVRLAARAQKERVSTGGEGLSTETGTVTRSLDPEGKVFVHGEIWNAASVGGPIPKGTRVRVVQVHDMRLTVEPLEARGNEPEEGREE